jgi:hypothetical protein
VLGFDAPLRPSFDLFGGDPVRGAEEILLPARARELLP